jgi:hypothetical protein
MIPTIAGDMGLNLAIKKFQKMIKKTYNTIFFAKCKILAQRKKTLNRTQLKNSVGLKVKKNIKRKKKTPCGKEKKGKYRKKKYRYILDR